MQSYLVQKILEHRDEIEHWLLAYEKSHEVPVYLSTDIRDGDFKTSVVDSNFFPAGFNNICQADIPEASSIMRKALLARKQNCRSILLVIEEHTRNKHYLENVYRLKTIIESAGMDIIVTMPDEAVFGTETFLELETIQNNKLILVNVRELLPHGKWEGQLFDLILLNHDLINGVPKCLKTTQLDIYPALQAGWHSRTKANHFELQRKTISEFGAITGLDPWFFSCLDKVVHSINVHEKSDLEDLSDKASELFAEIRDKYSEYNIHSKPFIFLKANYGTYGMGVVSVQDPIQLVGLNRKMRNRLYKGKGSSLIHCYILQEGVPSIHSIEDSPAEVCIYQINNQYIGSFYRMHVQKSEKDNLNSPGMQFRSIGQDRSAPCNDTLDTELLYVYHLLSRISGIAGMEEIKKLQDDSSQHEVCLSH